MGGAGEDGHVIWKEAEPKDRRYRGAFPQELMTTIKTASFNWQSLAEAGRLEALEGVLTFNQIKVCFLQETFLKKNIPVEW